MITHGRDARARLRALAFLLTAAAALIVAASAHAAPRMEVAISDEDAFVKGTSGDPERAFQQAEALNVTRMRILVEWSRVSDAEQSTPASNSDYSWGEIDNAIDLAAAHGMRTQLVLAGPAPAYASGNRRVSIPVVRPNPSRYAAFARAAAEHFKGRVDRYSIWNEPNYPAWLSPQSTSAHQYRKLFTAGYRAIKAADPRAQVLIGETVPYGGRVRGKRLGLAVAPLKWLRTLACVDKHYRRKPGCKPLEADGYAHHPYEFTKSPTSRTFPGADNAPIQTLSRLRVALNKLARARALRTPSGRPLDIYLTESGYFVTGKRRVAARKRTRWLPQQFQVAQRQPRVREMLQYNLFVPTTTTFTTGLLTPDGTPLPEYRSLRSWTTGAAASGRIKRNAGPIELPPRPELQVNP